MEGVQMEQSVYIVKPEGMLHRDSIRQMITNTGLSIIDSYIVTIPKWVPATLYPDLSLEKGRLWELTCQQFVGKRCEIGVVSGEGAIGKLLAVCGTEISPARCASQTIRRVYGFRNPIKLPGGGCFWFNAIHRPKNREEVLRDANIHFILRSAGFK
ncbi:MAG: nucleoside-diphosphate kinase [bacterium]|nr:nucleoside-diphosphate kinase [bacterium]